ncbi:MAG: steroid 5-alpha reductase family enzyme [Rhodothermales bacterium]|jgi:steroid 5-alpha reductase family enzyme
MPDLNLIVTVLGAILAYTTGAWLLSLWLKDSGIMDVFWGPGFLLAVGFASFLDPGTGWRISMVHSLVGFWAIRLALHIGARNAGQPEDARYAKWRSEAGDAWWWMSWFKVFLLQGVIMWVVAWPLLAMVTSTSPGPAGLLVWVGEALFFGGVVFEAVADWQLTRFKAIEANRGKVLDTGLWRYSRHPNYFGESVIWVGVGFWALSLPGGWPLLVGPALMIWLIIKVSGVAMLDKHLKDAKPKYRDYMRGTSAFVPLPPRNASGDHE